MQLNISVEILDDIVQEAVKHTKRTHPKRNIIVDMYDEIIPVMADANLIVQVIVNLMDNAVKYSDEDSDVTVSVRRENAHTVVISVPITALVSPMKKKKRYLICSIRVAAVPQTAEEVWGWGLHCAGQLLLHTAVLYLSETTYQTVRLSALLCQ